MLKKGVFKYLLISFTLLFLGLAGCDNSNQIMSIYVENQSQENPINFVVGEFSFDNLFLVVNYESGETTKVSISEEMVSDDDIIKLYKLGKNEIELTYERKKTTMYVYGTYKQFIDLTLNDVTRVYNGEEFKVEVEGNIPKTAQVVYPNGNTYKNVGTYETKAIVFENGFEVLELAATVVIEKATYDMSGIEFADIEYTYDGREKMLYIQGELPDGVSVSYFINGNATAGMVNCGSYEVVAVFDGDARNYELIDEQKATLTINKAKHNMEGIRLDNAEFEYNDCEYELILKNESLIPQGVEVIYKNNKHTDAGIYEVVAEFVIDDPLNYETIEPLTAMMKIKKAEYDFGDLAIISEKVHYEPGKTYQLSFNQEFPEFINYEYFYYPKTQKGVWSALQIDATDGYWYCDNQGYLCVGAGTVITLEVGTKTLVSLNGATDINNFDVEINEGIATITCVNADKLTSIVYADPSDELVASTIDVTLCDMIFHNEKEPLESGILPSLKGEYLVVVKLVVEYNNYYGEKELTAFLIIE